jgi:hypothetical protein
MRESQRKAASAENEIRDNFLGWQCRIRQHAMRGDGGRPSAGMRPRAMAAVGPKGAEIAPAITTLIVPRAPAESTEFLRHQASRTRDPKVVYEHGLAYLQATHFQQPSGFSDVLTALFGPASDTAAALLYAGTCMLEFEQFSQGYFLPCTVARLADEDSAYAATWWHNRVFNPDTPPDAVVLAFTPDWTRARADPPV